MSFIRVADYTRNPGGRNRSYGPFSGEWFREDIVVPALEKAGAGEKVEVDIDGTSGYSGSFLEEAFGALVRRAHLSDVESRLSIVSNDRNFEIYKLLAEKYIREAKHSQKGDTTRLT